MQAWMSAAVASSGRLDLRLRGPLFQSAATRAHPLSLVCSLFTPNHSAGGKKLHWHGAKEFVRNEASHSQVNKFHEASCTQNRPLSLFI
mmetsp:Transcript_24110/g.47347  ORF Transcript_24110/g.47347 Transcript_24110/m.47347 type:complete len:89 (-) Transcript_24110:100-366(-)